MIPGKTYLLHLVNAALNSDLFFGIANHTLTIVEVDTVYVKPFQTNIILITPSQTTNVLFIAMSQPPNATFLMFAGHFSTGTAAFDNSTSVGFLGYVSNIIHFIVLSIDWGSSCALIYLFPFYPIVSINLR